MQWVGAASTEEMVLSFLSTATAHCITSTIKKPRSDIHTDKRRAALQRLDVVFSTCGMIHGLGGTGHEGYRFGVLHSESIKKPRSDKILLTFVVKKHALFFAFKKRFYALLLAFKKICTFIVILNGRLLFAIIIGT